MMTKAVALECAGLRNKVRVNSIHPGVVDTPAWSKHGPEEVGRSRHGSAGTHVLDPHEVAKTMVPIGVACSAEEVAETIRSEEHTSELQSLMRISYTVCCMKTKQNPSHIADTHT